MIEQVFIGLGSNLEQPEIQINTALQELAALPETKLLMQSSLYRSQPMGPQDQDEFINAVVKLETGLSAIDLLDALQAIENRHGRKRLVHWGPRTLDLDILSYGNVEIDNERLTLPHPEIKNRTFVLVPWLEIEDDFYLPNLGSIQLLLEENQMTRPIKIS